MSDANDPIENFKHATQSTARALFLMAIIFACNGTASAEDYACGITTGGKAAPVSLQQLKEAESGDMYAQISVGRFYQSKYEETQLSGTETVAEQDSNYKQAEEWYKRAAQQGAINAQAVLASLYLNNAHTTKGKDAYFWATLSAAGYATQAGKKRLRPCNSDENLKARAEQLLTQQEREEVLKRVTEWKPTMERK